MDAETKLKMIAEIMDGLQEDMEMGEDDFNERLGRKKPEIEVKEELVGKDIDGDMEMGESPDHVAAVLGGDMMDEESPEEKLKARIMKIRG